MAERTKNFAYEFNMDVGGKGNFRRPIVLRRPSKNSNGLFFASVRIFSAPVCRPGFLFRTDVINQSIKYHTFYVYVRQRPVVIHNSSRCRGTVPAAEVIGSHVLGHVARPISPICAPCIGLIYRNNNNNTTETSEAENNNDRTVRNSSNRWSRYACTRSWSRRYYDVVQRHCEPNDRVCL